MWYIAAAQVSVGAATQLTPALGAVIAVRLSGSTGLAGAATSTLGLGRMLIAYSIGAITDRLGRKVGLFIGLFLSLVGGLLAGFSVSHSSLGFFFVGILIFGFGAGAISQLRVAATDMYPPSRRAEAVGFLLTGSLVGAFGGLGLVSFSELLAPALGADRLALPWLLTPAVILPAAFFIARVRPDPLQISMNLDRYYPSYRRPAPAATGTAPESGGMGVFVRDYPVFTAFVSYFAVQGNMSMMMAMTSLVLSHHGHGLSAISLSVAITWWECLVSRSRWVPLATASAAAGSCCLGLWSRPRGRCWS
jgi:MFS family permease